MKMLKIVVIDETNFCDACNNYLAVKYPKLKKAYTIKQYRTNLPAVINITDFHTESLSHPAAKGKASPAIGRKEKNNNGVPYFFNKISIFSGKFLRGIKYAIKNEVMLPKALAAVTNIKADTQTFG
jgi:hypothetical protein